MRGSEPAQQTAGDRWSLAQFGVDGRLIDWDFEGMGDALGMYPENLAFGYWVDLNVSEDLNNATVMTLPTSVGLMYNDQLYPSKIERVSWGVFDDNIVEFHWIKPYKRTGYGLAIPYHGYQMIPLNTDLFNVMGMPTLFGTQVAVEKVLDVIAGESPTTERFVLPYEENDDLQVSCLGIKELESSNVKPPIGGDYQEFYLGVSQSEDGYSLKAKYFAPGDGVKAKAQKLAGDHGLEVSESDGILEVAGPIESGALPGTLGAFLAS